MASISAKRHSFLSRFKTLLPSQYLYHKFIKDGNKPRTRGDKDPNFEPGAIDISKWKKMDSRSLGITRAMVPSSPYTLLKILRSGGFEAYLVGGCVRDLLLNRAPKDFDVITTANLYEIKKQFHRCIIVGRRFPICRVHIKGSVIEVASFKTLAKHSEDKEKFLVSRMPRGCDKSDLNLWKNSMHRDFTVNSLFFDPINYKIYDYNNGMKDLLELKLRTLVPAHLSFTEDCARILRGLRIAARLGLSFSKDIESAIHKHASSIFNLSTSRIMMEIDYMLSYGAAESSLRLLHRFHILEILLPFQAAYISSQTSGSGECTMMLMKLFSHMDKFISCDHPSASCLWIGLLAFHQTLVIIPQHPFVVLTLGSVLYHQNWEDGLKFARKYSGGLVSFEPETLDPYEFISDDEVAKKVTQLAMRVIDSIDVLMDTDSLHKTMEKFPGFRCSGLVFVSKNSGHSAANLFHVLTHKVKTYSSGRNSFEMNYQLLGKGDASETRFALGRIILNTLRGDVDQNESTENLHLTPYVSTLQQPNAHNPKKQKLNANSSSSKKQNEATEKNIKDGYSLDQKHQKEAVCKQDVEEPTTSSYPKTEDCTIEKSKEASMSQSPMQEIICTLENITEPPRLESQISKERLECNAEMQVDQSTVKEQKSTTKEQNLDRQHKRKQVLTLSSLFK